MRSFLVRVLLVAVFVSPALVRRSSNAQPASTGSPAPAGMPDLASISGKPLPDRGMTLGTVMVRVARQTPSNPISGVEITALVEAPGGEMRKRTAKTDAAGRALFEAVPAGHHFHATVVVAGEKLVTDTFDIPAVGGIRVMLIAGLGAGDAQNGSAAPRGEGGDQKAKPFSLGIIAGTAAPDSTLPAGTIHVHAVDEGGQPLAGRTVEVGHVRGGGQLTVTRQVTGSDGVARFSDLNGPAAAGVGGAAGGETPAEIGAAVVMQVGVLRLGTDGFAMPSATGVKVDLRVPQRTADPSVISIGAGGRVILQLRDETVSFIESLPLENHSDKLFDPGPGGVEIPLPSEFTGADVADGEHKIEIRKGIGVAVHGIIPPRRAAADPNRKSPDEVTFGFVLPATGSTRDFVQRFPNGLGEFTFITDDLPNIVIESAQITGRQPREAGGKKYWLMRGEPIAAGGTLHFVVRGLPAPDITGRVVASILALALVAAALLFARGGTTAGGAGTGSEREKLVQRREKLFSDLVGLETRPVAADRGSRAETVQKLEAVYREIAALDERRAV